MIQEERNHTLAQIGVPVFYDLNYSSTHSEALSHT